MTNYMNEYKRSLKLNEQKAKCQKGGTPQPGEVWWVPNLEPGIDSPAVVITAGGGRVVVRKIIKEPENQWHRDAIDDYIKVGLDYYKYVETLDHYLPKNRLIKKMGKLSDRDRRRLGIC